MANTTDEKYLLMMHKKALEAGDLFTPFEPYEIGRLIGQNERSVKNIVRMLLQTNFIKRDEKDYVFLTSNGLELIEQLS